MKRYRRRNKEGVTKQGVTSKGVTNFSHILNWLVDPVKREKLERICTELGKRNLLDQVFIGTEHPVDLYTVNEWLEATA